MVTPEPESAFRANPGIGMPRYIGEDVRVGDTVVPRGTTVMCSMAASNHDETAFEGADDMTLGRSPNVHLSFGSGAPLVPGAGAGPHRTAGRPRRAAA